MGRPRYQTGHLQIRGKQNPSWVGFFYETVKGDDGKTTRVHRSTILGLTSELTKTEAKKKLTAVLSRFQNVRPDAGVTLRLFIEKKWIPLKEAKWKESTKLTSLGIIQKQIVEPLGDIPLRNFDRSVLQQHLNDLATKGYATRIVKDTDNNVIYNGYSQSIVQHTLSFLKQIFDEAEDQEFVIKSPARRLEVPRVHPVRIISPDNNVYTGKPFLGVDELRKLLGALEGRNRLIVMLASLCAMRPGEIFALTWDSWRDDTLFIMRRVYRHKFDSPKTPTSMAQIPVPKVVRAALEKWKANCPDANPLSFIFPGKVRDSVLDQYNFSDRVLKPSGTMASGTAFTVTFQVLRRTWATHAPIYGAGLKEIEAVLRHSASLNFTTGTYIQAVRERVLAAMDNFANAVCKDLPEYASIPVEKEEFVVGCGHEVSQDAS
jgi:integrase